MAQRLIYGTITAGRIVQAATENTLSNTGLTYNSITNTLTVDGVQWDLTPTATGAAEGLMYWNTEDGTLNLGMPGGNVNLQIGQELIMRAKNETGSPITNGQLVYISGGTGNNAIISLAKADAEITSATTIGMATEAIADSHFGYVTLIGLVRDVNTISYTAGTSLYLSAATAGAYTSTKPVAPNHLVTIGVVIRQHATEGVIFVRIDNGYELSELHDVYINSIADGNILQYVNANSRWENKTLAGAGLVSGTGTANYVTKFTGASTIGNSLIQDDGTSIGINATPTAASLVQITTTPTITSGTFNGLNLTYNANPASASSGTYQGLAFAVGTQSGNAQNFSQALRGVVGQASHNGTGLVDKLTGIDAVTQINSSGNVTTAYGIRLTSVAGSTGRAGSNYGLYIENTAPFTTINTAIGIAATSGAGSLKYGLSIGAITGGTGANVAIETLGGQLQFTHNANSTLATFTGSGTFTAATPLVLMTRNDANTAVVVTNLTLRANTTGTAAAGFGVKLNYEAESSTTASQTIAYDERLWTDATHASRTALYRGTTTGNAANSGFYGAWSHNAIANTAITIIPNGTGDVASVGTFVYTVKDNTAATTSGGVVVLNPNGGAVSLLSDGTDTLQITCAADGSVTIARSAGSHTFSVSIWGTWQ